MTLIKQLLQTWKIIKDNRDYLVPAVVLDLIFFISFILIYTFAWTKILENMLALDNFLSAQATQLTSVLADTTAFEAFIATQDTFAYHYHQVIYYSLLMFLGIFIMWSITQGINWFMADKLANRKKFDKKDFFKIFGKYLAKFTGLAFLQTCIVIILIALYAKLAVSSAGSAVPALSESISNLAVIILFVLLFYFTFISYSLIPEKNIFKNTFVLGAKKFVTVIKAYAVTIVLFVSLAVLFYLIFNISLTAAILFVILIKLPTLTFSRIFFIRMIKDGR